MAEGPLGDCEGDLALLKAQLNENLCPACPKQPARYETLRLITVSPSGPFVEAWASAG